MSQLDSETKHKRGEQISPCPTFRSVQAHPHQGWQRALLRPLDSDARPLTHTPRHDVSFEHLVVQSSRHKINHHMHGTDPSSLPSGETGPADTLLLDLQPPEYETIHFCCLSPPS